jgi:hypothetical protein
MSEEQENRIKHLERTIKCNREFIDKLLKTTRDQEKKIKDLVKQLDEWNSKKAEVNILKAKNYKIKSIAENLTKIEKAKFQEKL